MDPYWPYRFWRDVAALMAQDKLEAQEMFSPSAAGYHGEATVAAPAPSLEGAPICRVAYLHLGVQAATRTSRHGRAVESQLMPRTRAGKARPLSASAGAWPRHGCETTTSKEKALSQAH